jgi:hypothetical protein
MRASSIDTLDPRLKALIDEKLAAKVALDDILDAIRPLGAEISRSALGRYKQRVDEVGGKLRAVQEAAKSLVAPLREAASGEQVELIAQMLQSILFRVAMKAAAEDEPDEALSPKDLNFLAKSARELQAARKVDVDRQIAAERLDATKKAAGAAREAMVAKGLSAETAAEIERAVLGLKS